MDLSQLAVWDYTDGAVELAAHTEQLVSVYCAERGIKTWHRDRCAAQICQWEFTVRDYTNGALKPLGTGRLVSVLR